MVVAESYSKTSTEGYQITVSALHARSVHVHRNLQVQFLKMNNNNKKEYEQAKTSVISHWAEIHSHHCIAEVL